MKSYNVSNRLMLLRVLSTDKGPRNAKTKLRKGQKQSQIKKLRIQKSKSIVGSGLKSKSRSSKSQDKDMS